MPPIEPIQAIVGGGSAVLLAVGIWWLATGRGRVGTLVDKDKAADLVRLQGVEKERDDWKAVAQSIGPEIHRLNDLLDTAVKLLLERRIDS